MNALDLLKEDHQRVSALFEDIESAQDAEEKRSLFLEVKAELDAHAFIEETVLYPLFAKRDEFKEIVEDSLDDHQEVKDLLTEIDETESDEDLDDKLAELIELVERHVEEEENDFFPEIEQQMSAEELDEIGDQLEETRRSMPEAA